MRLHSPYAPPYDPAMPTRTLNELSSLLRKLATEREQYVAAIEEIDAVFAQFGMEAPAGGARRRRGRPPMRKAGKKAGRTKAGAKKRGRRRGGKRVQGVKQTLLDTLGSKPQSPIDLQKKVSKKLGAEVNIATQLQMLKSEGKAKAVGRGQWVAA